MYHCHINFYCLGLRPDVFDTLREMPALSPFAHAFTMFERPDPGPAAMADVIMADLRDMDAPAAMQLLSSKKEDAQLILLADQGQLAPTAEQLAQVTDI